MPDLTSARPRLLILTSTLPRWEGDSEPRFVLDLANSLQAEFDPLILAPMAFGAAPIERLDGIPIHRYRYAPFRKWEKLASPGAIMPNLRKSPLLYVLVPCFFVAQAIAIIRLLRRERFELIHCHWLIPQGFVLAIVSLFVKTPPALLTCHGADVFTLDGPLLHRLKSWVMRRFHAITAVSLEITEKLERISSSGLRTSPVHIPMGVDLQKFGEKQRSRAGVARLLFAGRLAAKKGVGNLLEALATPRLRNRELQLFIVGDGPMLHDLRTMVRRLELEDKVIFKGAVPHDELVDQLRSASIFCAPFIIAPDGDREGTPTVLIEAAASRLPIITSDVGGCAEIVMDGKAGWLIPSGDVELLADAIEQALNNPALAADFAEKASEQANRYAWTSIADQHAVVLNRIIKESRGLDEA